MRFARLGKCCSDLFVGGHVDLAKHSADIACDLLAALGVAVENGDLCAPAASARAVASPRPDAAPVTTAATPLMSIVVPQFRLRVALALNGALDKGGVEKAGELTSTLCHC